MTETKNYKALSPDDTHRIAQELAKTAQIGDIYTLNGTLGAGKTHFARGFIHAATHNPDQDVPSPTFTLVQLYDGQNYPIWHFDLYRLEHPDEIYEIGWEEAISNAVLLVEWPERLAPHMLCPDINRIFDITLEITDENTRAITIQQRQKNDQSDKNTI